jgi:hypothetical protein
MGIARGNSHPGHQATTELHHNQTGLNGPHTTPNRRTQLTGAPQAADWTEVEADVAAAEKIAAENAAAENTAAENAAAENATAESDTEMTASGTAPPMTS